MKHIWIMRDGTKIAVKDMNDSHLDNAIAMMERNAPSYQVKLVNELNDIAASAAGYSGFGEEACAAAGDAMSDYMNQANIAARKHPKELLDSCVQYRWLKLEKARRLKLATTHENGGE